jgi:hypothetical protein
MKIGRAVKQGFCLSPILFNLCSECLTVGALGGFGELNIGGQIINSVKCADGLVLLVKGEMVLQDRIGKLIEIGRSYGMEMNVEKQKLRISGQPYPVKLMIDQKQLENVEFFKYLGSMVTNDWR